MAMIKASAPCPCESKLSYGECCGPLHRGTSEAPSAEAVMRSRYSAYAVGNFDYLVKSLAPTHEDLSQGTDTLKAILRQSSAGVRYMGLRIVGTEAENAEGDSYVLFVARMFERGKNCSLVELARFRRFDGAFRYVDGDARPFKAAAWEAPHAPLSLSSYRASQASG